MERGDGGQGLGSMGQEGREGGWKTLITLGGEGGRDGDMKGFGLDIFILSFLLALLPYSCFLLVVCRID